MFCPKCGTAQANGAVFCHKCGKEIPQEIRDPKPEPAPEPAIPDPSPAPVLNRAGPNDARAVFPDKLVAAKPEKPQKLTPVTPSKRQIASSIFAVVLLCLMYFSIIDPAFYGHEYDFKKSGGGFLVIATLCYWYLFKSRGYRGWLGVIFGVVSSFVVLIGAAAVAAHARKSPAYIMEHSPQVAALQKAHPKEYAAIEKEISAARERGAQPAEIQALVSTKIMPLTYKAILSASDGAALEYSQAKVRMFRDVAAKSAEDCALLMSGKATEAGPRVLARILSGVPEDTQTALKKSLARVIEESGDLDTPADPKAGARFDALYEQIDAKLKAKGSSAYFFGDEKKPADVRCKAGLGIFEEAQNLPSADRTFMLRQLLGAS